MQSMISAECVALVRALQRHPNIRAHVGEAWRVKRLSPKDLLQLARRLGIDMEPIRERTEAALHSADPWAASRWSPQPPQRMPGAFTGAVEFPLVVDLLGHRVERRARVRWGYTPEWDHHSATLD
jgi:hypothetical protein